MLETDDIDDDFFTPVPSTSLANIFGEPSKNNDVNESLKYTPPKKQVPQEKSMQAQLEAKSNEELKVNECMFACAVTAYEWINNNYLPRGKLGFAILKILRTNSHNIILYSPNKTTLSSTIITTELNMNLKGKNYISYYDINNKYWSVYGTEEDMNKITEILQNLGVDVKNTSRTDHKPPELNITPSSGQISEVLNDKESDTDSSINRRTKASILNRMANMGHSVLPSSTLVDRSSESSESNETQNQLPKIRPKPTKTSTKKSSIDKKSSELDTTDCIKIDSMKMPISKIEQSLSTSQAINPTLFAIINGQLIPVSNPNTLPVCGNNEMNLFMTEQRVNNNELRVNINRTTDKVDQVLEKMKSLERPNVSHDLQIEVMQKLLTEYEKKIKNYEYVLASNRSLGEQTSDISERVERATFEVKILDFQSAIEEKNKEIVIHENFKKQLLIEINQLKEDLILKTDEVEKLSKQLIENTKVNKTSDKQAFETRLKEVINDVYHSISINFESDESYSGDNVMKIIASVLKKTAMQSLSK